MGAKDELEQKLAELRKERAERRAKQMSFLAELCPSVGGELRWLRHLWAARTGGGRERR